MKKNKIIAHLLPVKFSVWRITVADQKGNNSDMEI